MRPAPHFRQPPDGIPRVTPGDFLRKAREYAGLNQDTLAKRIGCCRSTILEGERNVRVPKRQRIRDWADACGVDREWLVVNVQLATRRPPYTFPTGRFDLRAS